MTSKPKHHALLLEGLAQALASPAGIALFASKTSPGLFPNNAAGKSAAREALFQGWLTKLSSQPRGKTTVDVVALTTQGSNYVLDHLNPRLLLEAVQKTLTERAQQLVTLLASLRTCQHDIDTLRARVEGIADRLGANSITATTARVNPAAWEDHLTAYLLARQHSRPAEDCPLPELFRQAKDASPSLSVGEFHEGLRRLQAERRLALQPWTGPLHELPEPDLALMQGHSLAYYASPAAQ